MLKTIVNLTKYTLKYILTTQTAKKWLKPRIFEEKTLIFARKIRFSMFIGNLYIFSSFLEGTGMFNLGASKVFYIVSESKVLEVLTFFPIIIS